VACGERLPFLGARRRRGLGGSADAEPRASRNLAEAWAPPRRNFDPATLGNVDRAAACRPERTRHGVVPACADVERWPSGSPRRCTPAATCRLMTRAGVLTPRAEPDAPRHPRVSPLEFHHDGQVARIALADRVTVPTPVGPLPAELLRFHRDGSIDRVFPANGKLGPLWTVDDEQAFVPHLRIATPVGILEARFIAVAFYPAGNLRSLTLWPDERVMVTTPVGPVLVRQGLSFHADGTLASAEPARPHRVETRIGPLSAFDPQPVGLNADQNSLRFAPDGALAALLTDRDTLLIDQPDGSRRRVSPVVRAGDCSDGCSVGAALEIRFQGDEIVLQLGTDVETHPTAAVRVERTDDGRRHLSWVP
jgi:hypothetical protein